MEMRISKRIIYIFLFSNCDIKNEDIYANDSYKIYVIENYMILFSSFL